MKLSGDLRRLRSALAAPFAAGASRTLLSLGLTTTTLTNPNAPAARLNYCPEGLYFWDSWFFTKGDEEHVIHLQKKRPGSTRPDERDGALGHAVSTDLFTR